MGTRAFVDSWLKRRARTASAYALAGEALTAVWNRARRSLSEVVLQALAQAALEDAAREFPLLADVRIGPAGFDASALSDAAAGELLPALGGLLAELLSLVEQTSGAILAPALEAELLHVGGRRTPPGGVRTIEAG